MPFGANRPSSRLGALRVHLDRELERLERGFDRLPGRRTNASRGLIRRSAASRGRGLGPGVVAGLLVAAATVAGALFARSRNESDARVLVVPDGSSRWLVRLDGSPASLGSFETRREAVRTARAAAIGAAPSRLVIHNADGSVARMRRYRHG